MTGNKRKANNFIKMSKEPLRMDTLRPPTRIVKMNSPLSAISNDDEAGLGFHHTLVSRNRYLSENFHKFSMFWIIALFVGAEN